MAETRTVSCPRMGERVYAQRCQGTQGDPKWALGRLLWCKEVHFRFAKQIPNLEYCLTVQQPFAQPEFLPQQKIGCKIKNSRKVNCSQGEELVLRPKENMARKPVQGVWPWNPLAIYVRYHRYVVRADYHMTPSEKGEKLISTRKTALSSRQFMCQERNSILRRCESNCATPWLGKWLVLWSGSSTDSSTKGMVSCGAILEVA